MLWEKWHSSSEKLDYYIIGIAVALFAYLSQSYVPQKLGLSPSIVDILALLFLLISIFAGLFCLKTAIFLTRTNYEQLEAKEKLNTLRSIPKEPGSALYDESGEDIPVEKRGFWIKTLNENVERQGKALDVYGSRLSWCYKIRNIALFLAFVLILLSKIARAYLLS